MKKIGKLKLINLDKEELEAKQMAFLKGGVQCCAECVCEAECSLCLLIFDDNMRLIEDLTASQTDSVQKSSEAFGQGSVDDFTLYRAFYNT